DRFALAAAAEACRAAALDAGLRRTAALAVGATTGGMFETEEVYRRRRAGEERRFRLSRVLGTPLSTAAAAVSQALGIYGPQATFSTACSSSALAVAPASAALRPPTRTPRPRRIPRAGARSPRCAQRWRQRSFRPRRSTT